MPRRSRSRRSDALAAALATVTAGCLGTLMGGRNETLELRIDQAGGAAIVATWEPVDEKDDLDIGVAAALSHHGAEPCHVAVYLHATEPAPTDIPTLTGPPAPETAGELLWEGVLLPPRDGVVFTSEVGEWDQETDLFHWPEGFHHFPPEPPVSRRWVTLATCAEPDIAVKMEVWLGFSRPALPRREDGPDDMSAAVLWP